MGQRILYIEDEDRWRQLVRMALTEAGFEIVTAGDGLDAMKASEGDKLDLIILDLKLAGESGIMLMKFLKRNHPDVPILLYTGLDHDDTTIQAILEQGADHYQHKGGMQELLEMVRKILPLQTVPPKP